MENNNIIEKALIKAKQLHDGQFRKGGKIPYFVHMLDVCKILMHETDLDDEVIVAGILHDTLEDTNYGEQNLKKDFGERIYTLVKFCSEPGNTIDSPEEDQINSWKARKQHSINAINTATEEEIVVTISDKYSNLNSMKEDLILVGDNLWKRFNTSKEDIKWYYESMRDEAKKRISHRRTLILFDKLVDEVFSDN